MRKLALLACLVPALASAQTFTVELDGEVGGTGVHAQAQVGPIVVAPPANTVVVAPPALIPPSPPTVVVGPVPNNRPIVIVPPLHEDDVPRARVEIPREPTRMPQYTPPVQADPPPPSHHDEDEQIEGWLTFGGFGQSLSLEAMPLELGRPEVVALQGAMLDRRWSGMDALRNAGVGGITLGAGMRSFGFIRGPELSLSFGGSNVHAAASHLEGTPQELSVSPESLFFFRAQLAFGVQCVLADLLVPYVMLRGSVGAYWLGVEVHHESLGRIGGEQIDNGLYEFGVEGGIGFRMTPNLELTGAVTANFVGPSALGATMSIAYRPD
jgi:hypothetical protein